MSALAAGTVPTPATEPHPRRWVMFYILALANFLTICDIFVVNIGIPTIMGDLHATLAQMQFVLAGYQLAYGVAMITGSRLGDIYGRKRLIVIGFAAFTVASVLCSMATWPNMLIAARVLQGLAAALMLPQMLAMFQVLFSPAERPRVFGAFGALIGIGGFTGQIMGGALIRLNVLGLGWRALFLVNLPIGIIGVAAAAWILIESKVPNARKLDLGGMALISVALLLLTYPMVQGRDMGWPAWAFVAILLSLPTFALFLAYEHWMIRQGKTPLLELSLFKERAFVVGLPITVLFYGITLSIYLVLTLFLQDGLRLDSWSTALAFVPLAIGFFIGSTGSIKLVPRWGVRVIEVGAILFGLGLAAEALATVYLVGDALRVVLAIILVVQSLGQGFVLGPLMNVLLGGMPPSKMGSASGVLATVQQIGAALGVAVSGIVFFGVLGVHGTHTTAPYAQYAAAYRATMIVYLLAAVVTFFLLQLLPRSVRVQTPSASGPSRADADQDSAGPSVPDLERRLSVPMIAQADSAIGISILWCTCGSPQVLRNEGKRPAYICERKRSSGGRDCQIPELSLRSANQAACLLLKRGLDHQLALIESMGLGLQAGVGDLDAEFAQLLAKRGRILEQYEDGLYGDGPGARALRDEKLAPLEVRCKEIRRSLKDQGDEVDGLRRDLVLVRSWQELPSVTRQGLLARHIPGGLRVRADRSLEAEIHGMRFEIHPTTRPLVSAGQRPE